MKTPEPAGEPAGVKRFGKLWEGNQVGGLLGSGKQAGRTGSGSPSLFQVEKMYFSAALIINAVNSLSMPRIGRAPGV